VIDDQGVYVQGLTKNRINSAEQAIALLNRGASNRRVRATAMNAESSRSHSVFTVELKSTTNKGGAEEIRCSRLNLIDLAGSERYKNTQASDLTEASSINLSLTHLGQVIKCLASKQAFVPYRNSKLTSLLRVGPKKKKNYHTTW
jgi:kinesin family protein 15